MKQRYVDNPHKLRHAGLPRTSLCTGVSLMCLARPILHLCVGGDDTIIACNEIDLSQATTREQRRRGKVGTARAPL